MAEVLVQFDPPVTDEEGHTYVVRICGRLAEDGLWEGWIEFDPVDGGPTLRTPRETEQPNRKDLEYWATGVTLSYLEGALERARDPRVPDLRPRTVAASPTYDRPAPRTVGGTPTAVPHGLAERLPALERTIPEPARPHPRAVLNPFNVYSNQGEDVLQQQLNALDEAQLRNIIRAYELVREDEIDTHAMHRSALAELIVAAVRKLYGA